MILSRALRENVLGANENVKGVMRQLRWEMCHVNGTALRFNPELRAV
jgi:hypothetical protein